MVNQIFYKHSHCKCFCQESHLNKNVKGLMWPLALHGVYRSKEWKKSMAKIYASSQAGDGVFNLCCCSHCRKIRGGSHDGGDVWFRQNYSPGNTPRGMTHMKEGSKGGGRGSQVLDSTAGTKTASGDPAVPKSISRQFVNNPTLYDEMSSRMGAKSDLLVCIRHQTHASRRFEWIVWAAKYSWSILLCCSWQLEHQRGTAYLIVLLIWKLDCE